MVKPTGNQYLVRAARPEDLENIRELMALFYVDQAARMGITAYPDSPMVARSVNKLDETLDNGTARCWLAVNAQDNKPVAFLFFNAGEMGEGLFAHPDHRKGGLGRVLVRAAEQELLAEGVQEATIPVIATNNMVINIYRRNGFEIIPGSEENGVLKMRRVVSGNQPEASP